MKNKGRQYIPTITGEFLPASEIRARAREHFLMAVMMVAPAPLYSLRDHVFQKFQTAFELEVNRGKSRDDIKDLCVFALLDVVRPEESTDIRSAPTYQAFRDSSSLIYSAIEELVAWSKRFNLSGKRVGLRRDASTEMANSARLDSLWPLVAALETILQGYLVHGRMIETLGRVPLFRPRRLAVPQIVENLGPIQLRTIVYDPRANISKEILDQLTPNGPPIENPKEVDTPAWNVEWEPEPVFRARALKDFKGWLNRYVADRKRLAQTAGLVKAPGKRELSHFAWAVEYQINEKSALVISKQHRNVTKYAVEKAVQGILEMIRLQPRDSRPGRHRASSPN